MLEMEIIAHCAPTLAGIKTANMFTYIPEHMDSIPGEVHHANEKLNSKGVYVEVLRQSEARALMYVYRPSKLVQDLKRDGADCLLARCGYSSPDVNCCLCQLKNRFCQQECFPHEVGLFLGYPLDDVTGFIEQKGKNYKCCGIWKVYGDEQKSLQIFCKLKKCSEIYKRLSANGRTIDQLTVAA